MAAEEPHIIYMHKIPVVALVYGSGGSMYKKNVQKPHHAQWWVAAVQRGVRSRQVQA